MFSQENPKTTAKGLSKVLMLELGMPLEQAACLIYGGGEVAKELKAILKSREMLCHLRADRKNKQKYDAIVMFAPMKSEKIAVLVNPNAIVIDASPYNSEHIHELSAFKDYRRIRIISVAQQF